MFSIEQIKAAKDRPREFVAIPEWVPDGETFDPTKHGVYVGTMSAGDRDKWEWHAFSRKGKDEGSNEINLRVATAIYSVQAEDGSPLFTEADAEWLSNKSAASLSNIFDVATRLAKVRKTDQEELLKNS